LKRKAKEQAHEQLKEEQLKLETAKVKKFYTLQKQLDQKQTEQSNSLKAAEGYWLMQRRGWVVGSIKSR